MEGDIMEVKIYDSLSNLRTIVLLIRRQEKVVK
jgi:hypothetical protein